MSYAVTHIIFSMFSLEVIKRRSERFKKFLPKYYLFLAAIGGLIPDLDIAAYSVLYFFGYSFEAVHRTFMHTIFIPLGLFLIGLLIYSVNKKEEAKKIAGMFFIFAIGTLSHLFLDFIDGKLMLIYPLSYFSVGLDLIDYLPERLEWLIPPIIEGLLLLAWIFWMNVVKKKGELF